MEGNKDRHFVVQYGKTGTRQKQLYTDDGELQIISKSSNAWIAILREGAGGKEVFRRPMSDLKSLVVGAGVSFGQISVYIDSEKENKSLATMSNPSHANTTNVTNSLSEDPKIKREIHDAGQPSSQTGLPGLQNLSRKFVLQGSKSLSGLSKPSVTRTILSVPTKVDAHIDKVEVSDFIDKPTPAPKARSQNENAPTNSVASIQVVRQAPSEHKIQSFMLKELKPHQLQAAEFLLTRLRGAPQNPTLESLFQAPSSSGAWEGYDVSGEEECELDWLEGSKRGGDSIGAPAGGLMDEDSKLYHGAILADEMGLGKSFVSLTVIWTLVKESSYKAVIVCPSSLISNWEKEVARWIGDFRCRPSVVRPGQNNKDLVQAYAYGNSPILIISYDMFRKFATDLNKISRFNILVCDEGHRLKNTCGTKTMDCLTTCKAKMRLVLTGTPIQNDLDELHSVVSFVAPGFLGSLPTFKTWIAGPILRMRDPGCSVVDKEAGQAAMKSMRVLMSQILLRRTQADVLRGSLPPRIDVVIQCRLSVRQKEQYEEEVQELFRNIGVSTAEIQRHTKATLGNIDSLTTEESNTKISDFLLDDEAEEEGTVSYSSVLPALQRLRQICNVVVEDSVSINSSSFSTAAGGGMKVQSGKELVGLSHAPKKQRIDDSSVSLNSRGHSGTSSKLQVLDSLLRAIHEHDPTEKVVIVSNFTGVLDRVSALAAARQWAYLRLDGSTVIKKRQQLVDTFNKGMDSSFLFLLSSKAGGVGLNLIGASRLVMMDADWNPATDRQAMGRIWRPGQKRSVVIYRLVAAGTIECSILQRQTMKIGLSAVFGKDTVTTVDDSKQPAESKSKESGAAVSIATSAASLAPTKVSVKIEPVKEPLVVTPWAFDVLGDSPEASVSENKLPPDDPVGNVEEVGPIDEAYEVPDVGFASAWTKSSLVQLVLPVANAVPVAELSVAEQQEKLDAGTSKFFSSAVSQQFVSSWTVE